MPDASILVLNDPPRVALDVEGDSFYRYGERLCLVQVAWNGKIEVLDPLADDLSGWMEALAPRQLVFHGADFDIRLLHQRYGFRPEHVFDTMLAARFLNIPKFGLSDLYERYFGVTLEKKLQRADWCRRPLTPELLDYARQDVARLEELADRLSGELDARGRTAWHREECDEVVRRTIVSATRPPDPEAWRVKGAGSLGRRELAFLRELHAGRDQVARQRDRALFRVIRNEELLELSRLASADPERALRQFSRPLPADLLSALSSAVARAAAIPPADYPERAARGERPEPWLEAAVVAIGKDRDARAAELDLEPSFLLPRAGIVRLARERPQTPERLAELLESRWRAQALGPRFLASRG